MDMSLRTESFRIFFISSKEGHIGEWASWSTRPQLTHFVKQAMVGPCFAPHFLHFCPDEAEGHRFLVWPKFQQIWHLWREGMWRSNRKLTEANLTLLGILLEEMVRNMVPVEVAVGDFKNSLFASMTSWSLRAYMISSSESPSGTSRMIPLHVVLDFGGLHLTCGLLLT